jgi:hypothetical protein
MDRIAAIILVVNPKVSVILSDVYFASLLVQLD